MSIWEDLPTNKNVQMGRLELEKSVLKNGSIPFFVAKGDYLFLSNCNVLSDVLMVYLILNVHYRL